MVNTLKRSNQRGFTLVELLVVVSIIALLISILLPTVGEVRRQARISLCTANMKQHAQGVSNYAAANQDTLPHVPKSNNKGVNAGKSPTPGFFANRDLPTNGVTFNGNGPQTAASVCGLGTVLNNNEYMSDRTLQAWNGYWAFLSEYMLDKSGSDVLDDIFLSPSHTSGRSNWRKIKQYVSNQAQTGNSTSNGWWTLTSNAGVAIPGTNPAIVPVSGSYRYVIAAMVEPKLFMFNSSRQPLALPQGVNYAFDVDFGSGGSGQFFQQYVKRIPTSAMDYPGQKVLFYMWNAWHNPNKDAWFQSDAVCPVALGDGSARSTIPIRDAIQLDYGNAENAGPYFRVYFTQDSNGSTVFTAYYMLTTGGIKGRDL